MKRGLGPSSRLVACFTTVPEFAATPASAAATTPISANVVVVVAAGGLVGWP